MNATQPDAIRYRIQPTNPGAHRFTVSCSVPDPDPEGQRFSLPAWIPGSYTIRDFARHVVAVSARCGEQALAVEKLDKDTWRCEPCQGALTLTLEVHAWELSVRTAHLDTTHAYFNGAAVFPRVHGHEQRPCVVDLQLPVGEASRRWRVATSMRRLAAPLDGPGTYCCDDYDELIDHPVEMGHFAHARFEACGVPHDVVVSGRHKADMERLCRDLKRLCEWQIRFFGEPAPMERYVFLVQAVGEGYGGLEHRASTSLMCSRDDLPRAGADEITEGYRTFLGLCSHEYFHSWNVKRIKPAAFAPYDLARENHTRLLWAFEGITAYYDDLALLRCGLIDLDTWLQLLGETATRVWRGPGRLRQSLADSSFDAWTKFYKPDANTPNAVVSYYTKGALVALALDLLLRRLSGGERSLDDLMRALWGRHGKPGIPVPEDGIERLAAEIAGADLSDFFARYVHGTEDPPLAELLEGIGIEFVLRPAEGAADKGGKPAKAGTRARADLGLRARAANGGLEVETVFDGGAAQAAGLAAGDVLLALDELKIDPRGFERQLAAYRPGDRVTLHAFRRDELMRFEVLLASAPADTAFLRLRDDAGEAALRARGAWSGVTST